MHERKTLKNLIHDIPYHWLWYKLVSATQPTIYTIYTTCNRSHINQQFCGISLHFLTFTIFTSSFFPLQCQMHIQCSHVMLRRYIRIYESQLWNNNCILPSNTQDCKQQYQLENSRTYCEPERKPTFTSWVLLQLFTWTGLFTAPSHNVLLLCIWWPKCVSVSVTPDVHQNIKIMIIK